MSIQATSERLHKRRKLSHSSEDDDDDSDHAGTSKATKNGNESVKRTRSLNSRASASHGLDGRMNGNNLAGGSSRSSLFALQAGDLIERTTPSYDLRLQKVRPEIDKVIGMIKAIPEVGPMSFLDAQKLLRKQGVSMPFAGFHPSNDIKYQFLFQKPTDICVRGALVLQLGAKGNDDIEVLVKLPASCSQPKDYLNYRAFHKRAFCIAYIAAALKRSIADEYKLKYVNKDGNRLLPIIQLDSNSKPATSKPRNTSIHVLLPSDTEIKSKMLPTKNCVRMSEGVGETAVSGTKPTPFYNSTFCALTSTLHYDQLLTQTAQRCATFKEACVLGHIWLQQRAFTTVIEDGGFGWYDWAVLTALMLNGGGYQNRPLFSEKYTSVQLFKAVLQILASRDLIKTPLVVGSDDLDWTGNSSPMLLDMSSGVNVLYKLTKWSYLRLKNHAQISLEAINSRLQNNFTSLFIYRISDILLEFDEVYTIDLPFSEPTSQDETQEQLSKMYEILKQGLGDRTSLMHIGRKRLTHWKIGATEGEQDHLLRIHLGLLVNADTFSRMLDRGPTAEEREEAIEFRKLWGDKSELRRFRDGSITETLVWSENTPVTYQIIQHLLLLHFDIDPISIVSNSKDLSSLRQGDGDKLAAKNSFSVINAKYQELSSKLHQLNELPLAIRAISPGHSNLRSATLRSPLMPNAINPTEITIQFDSSTRWPDHLPAIQYTKIAFLTKLSDLLAQSDLSCSTRLGIEDAESSTKGILNTSFLDIIFPAPGHGVSPVVFRLRIHHERELHLLQSQLTAKDFSRNSRESLNLALTRHKQLFIASPLHTTTLRNLITQFLPLSGTIRLLKSWMASHYLSNHILEPAIEIIAAHVFLRPTPWSVPGSASVAFIRCLHFLAHWDWASIPLIVDLSLAQDMPATAYTELETRLQAWRKLDPAMNNVAWFIGTNIDNTGTIWTQGARPARVVASRVTALANASIELIKNKGVAMQDEDWDNLFVSGILEFDFVIHLKRSMVRSLANQDKKENRAATQYKNLVVQQEMDTDDIGHDAVSLFLADIERAFTSSVLFFHGEGEKVIAGLWKPNALGMKEWRVSLGVSSVPVKSGKGNEEGEKHAMCEINQDGILNEISRLGEGIIEKIVLKKS